MIEEISPHDEMFLGQPEHYFRVGESALGLIWLALDAAGVPPPETIVDLPCGHGRVLRFLKAAFPDADLVACDLDHDAVDFCARTFGARAVYSVEEPGEIDLSGPVDLVWCGSLLTHVDAKRWLGFLELFDSLLSPSGVAVFTINGSFTRELLQIAAEPVDGDGDAGDRPEDPGPYRAREYFALPQASKERMLRDYDECGFGYADYPASERYGLSVASPAWVCRQVERIPLIRLVGFVEHGWDGKQDVVALARRSRLLSADRASVPN